MSRKYVFLSFKKSLNTESTDDAEVKPLFRPLKVQYSHEISGKITQLREYTQRVQTSANTATFPVTCASQK